MINYFDQKKNNNMKMQMQMPQRNTSYYRNVPNYYPQQQYPQQQYPQQQYPQQQIPRRNNFLNNTNRKVKRNVSESKKKCTLIKVEMYIV